ncbi:hypothetical protein ACPPVO_34795 [Dactylosporangium sp. McL0621]|uniref:hypothetical protein n=1 Tax=Dactylosporangium sp. McL0621 TaxID=3415678 RepID=UPI003CF1678B
MDQGGERGYWADEPGPDFALADAGVDLGGLMVGSVTRLPDRDDHVVPGGRFAPTPGGAVRRRWRRTLPHSAAALFGAAGGETGWDLVDGPDGPVVRAVDGRQVPLPEAAWPTGIVGVLRLPGGDRLLTADPFEELTLWDPQTATPSWRSRRPAVLPPIGWWDRMRPRDPAGSAALRTGDPAGVNDPVLRAAVEREATAAAELGVAIAGFRALLGEPAPAPVSAHAHDHNIRNSLFGLLPPWGGYIDTRVLQPRQTSGYGTISYLVTLPAVLAGPTSAQQRHARRWSARVSGWTQALPGLGALALRAALSTTPRWQRAALAALLTAVTDAGLADDAVGLTVVTVVTKGDQAPDPAVDLGRPADLAEGIASGFGLSCQRIVVAGAVPAHERYRVVERVPLGGWGDAGTVRRFVALLAERGPVDWRPEWVPAAVAAGLDLPADAVEALLTGARDVGPRSPWGNGEDRAAPDAIAELQPERLLQLLNASMPAEPERLWAAGPDVAALAEAWRAAPPDPPYAFTPWTED